MTSFEQGLLKSAKILLYHLGSIFLLGLGVWLAAHGTAPAWFVTALTHFGLPVATINAIWAGVEEAAQSKLPSGTTIDTAPPTA